MNSFWKRAGPLVGARLAGAAITFLIPLVLARVLSLTEYGTYKQLFLVTQTLYYVLPFGVAQSLYYFVPRAPSARPYLGQALGFLLTVALLGALAMYLALPPLARFFDNPALLIHRPWLCLYLVGLVGSYPLEIGLTSQGRTRASGLCYLGSDGMRALALVAPVLLGWGLSGMMQAMAAFALVRLAAAWLILLPRAQGRLFAPRAFVEQLLYAAPFGAAMALAIPQQYAHQYAVSAVVSPDLFALYAVGCFQLPLVDLLYTPTSEVLMVRIGELDREGRLREAAAAFREAAARLAYAFLPLCAFLWAAAPEFVGALFGARFLPAVPLFRVSVLAIALAILPLDGVLRARGQTRQIFFSYLMKAAVTVPLVFFGVKLFGMMGGIVSWALAEVVGKLTLLIHLPKSLTAPGEARLPWKQLLPWDALGRAAGAAALSALVVFALRSMASGAFAHLPAGPLWRALPLMVAGALFAAGYLGTLWMVGARPWRPSKSRLGVFAGSARP